jgi:methoxymalonate biosynthesis acyl carrier protein
LFETGVLDSLTFVDLVLYLEEQFDVRVGPDDMEPENFRSVAKISEFVAAHSGMNRVGAA